ncbi:hypothetical protein NEOLEDRAFT_1150299 [Neolentinus lepideus HHB14362 ss-1]|uniref:Uncharacterized protein n=1 Tax=Neolentinus lepideus HHB14362 ss-1 TaxID=1314782 RepID=A0A165Q764_9AGAM|nr:hypothetical protein NEOLEDRAFT_1150299 [Neolentinus lepideus HHB14362 ss-1]
MSTNTVLILGLPLLVWIIIIISIIVSCLGSGLVTRAYKVYRSRQFARSFYLSSASVEQDARETASLKSWWSWYDDEYVSADPGRLKLFKELNVKLHRLLASTKLFFVCSPADTKSRIREIPIRIKELWAKYFPRGPSLLLTSPSGRDLPVLVVTPPKLSKLRSLLQTPSPSLLHFKWKPRKTWRPRKTKTLKTLCRNDAEKQASVTPTLDAVSDVVTPHASVLPVFLPLPESPTLVSQRTVTPAPDAHTSTISLSPESPSTSTSSSEELPLPVQMSPVVNSAPQQISNAQRRWTWPSVLNVTRGRSFSLPGAENPAPTLRQIAESHKRMTELMFDAGVRDASKSEEAIGNSHKRLSDLMQNTAKRDAERNSAGLLTPPATPEMTNPNWGGTTASLEGELPRSQSILATFSSLPGDSAAFVTRDDQERDSEAALDDEQSQKRLRCQYRASVKSVEVAPEACAVAVEYWTPAEGEEKKCAGRQQPVFVNVGVYAPLPDRKVRAQLFRDLKRGDVATGIGRGAVVGVGLATRRN